MKIIKQILSWLNYYIAAYGCIGAGLFFIYMHINRAKLDSQDNIYEVKGTLKEYSFKRVKGYRATSKEYYLWLDNYPCKFQIKADFLSIFQQYKFEHDMKTGSHLNFLIEKEDQNRLTNRECRVFVYSVINQKSVFLDFDLAKKEERSNFNLFAGIGFFVSGIFLFLYMAMRRGRINVQRKYR